MTAMAAWIYLFPDTSIMTSIIRRCPALLWYGLLYCQFRGINVMCGPRGLKGERDHLFHNNGDGTFTDVSEKAGVGDAKAYYGLTAVFADVNNDGKPDLMVANDSTPNYLYLNKGNGTFEDVSYASGYAFNENGRETASMGIAVGDYRNNGLLDLYNTVFSDDYNPLYRNEGGGNFTDISYRIGHRRGDHSFSGMGNGLSRLTTMMAGKICL